MTLYKQTYTLLSLAAAALLAVACSGDEVVEEKQGAKQLIGFDLDFAFPDDVTKASTLVSSASGIGKMYVSCFSHEAGETDGLWYFSKQEYKKKSGVYSAEAPYYWLDLGKQYDFYAIVAGNNKYITEQTQNSFNYEVPNGTSNVDLMLATNSKADNYNTTVPLCFDHLLTGIRFKASTVCANVRITNIAIGGTYTKGTFSFATDFDLGDDKRKWSEPEWSNLNTLAKIDYKPSSKVGSVTHDYVDITTENKDILGPTEAAFFMIPQELNGAVLSVTFYFEGETTQHVISAPLKGHWNMGEVVTYILTIRSNELIVTVDPWIDNKVEVTQEDL